MKLLYHIVFYIKICYFNERTRPNLDIQLFYTAKLFSFYANLTYAILFTKAITAQIEYLQYPNFNINYEECQILKDVESVGYKYLAFQKPDN